MGVATQQQTRRADTAVAPAEEELTGLPEPMPAMGNQERLAEAGLARPRGSAKAELQAAGDTMSFVPAAPSALDGIGDGFRAHSDGVGADLERHRVRQPTLMSFLDSESVSQLDDSKFAADAGRYEGFAIRADGLAAEDTASRAMDDEAFRQAGILDEVIGEDGGSADAEALDSGLSMQGSAAPPAPASGPALEAVRLQVTDLGIKTRLAKAAAADLRQGALRQRAAASGARVDEIDAFVEECGAAVDTIVMMAGMANGLAPTVDFDIAEAGDGPDKMALTDPLGAATRMTVQAWYQGELDDLRAQMSALSERADQLGLVAERTRASAAVEELGLASARVDNARVAARAAVAADQASWQRLGIDVDMEARMAGELGSGEEAAMGAGLRVAKIEEVGQRLTSSRAGLAPICQKVQQFATEVDVFAAERTGIDVLTARRGKQSQSAHVARHAGEGLASRISRTDERLDRVSAATAMVQAVRDRQSA